MVLAMAMAMAFPSSIFLLLLLFPIFASSQNITVGTSLTAEQSSNPWRSSPNGDYAFGFQQLQNSTDQFILSIWLDKIPNKTIVWYERTTYPVPRGSTLRLDASDGLLLQDPQGNRLYSTSTGGGAGLASMNDTGNLVIFGNDSSVLWESFRHPADTILPTQTLEIGGALISRRTESDFSMGRFYAFISDSGNFVFNTKSVPSNSDYDDEYYSSFTSSENNASDAGVRVALSGGALISVVRRNGGEQILSPRSPPSPSDNYYRAILEFDGVFRLYYHPKNNSGDNPTWQVAGSWPANICVNVNGAKGSGACGYNSVCRIDNQRPVCECPKGFSLSDPTNPSGDCKPNSVQSCISGENGDEYELKVITDIDWPQNDYQQINPSSEDQCRSACLDDCLCGVAIYRSNSCWKKKLPLSNGKLDTTLGVKAFLKKRKTPLSENPSPPNKTPLATRDRRTLIVVLLGTSAVVNFFLVAAACLLLDIVYRKRLPPPIPAPARDSNLRCFAYEELAQATNGFEQELGRGAYGIVYKGTMPVGSGNAIAVKKLDRMFQDSDKEFKTEVNAIGRTHHKNLVGLIGFCDEGPHRLLVYEYMSNGTLAAFLFGDLKPSWSQRARMVVGIAKGLAYLHEECSTQIIHCDIKPQNILLDEYYNPRISDFGLAKLLTLNQSKTLTNIRGTKGYVAPEWFRNTQISVKVDVYSFGVVLLEIVSCRRILEDMEEVENPILTDWAWDCLAERRLDALVEKDEEALKDREMVERFIKVGLWCVEEDADLRPTMLKACQMLEGVVQVSEPPLPSSFSYVV